MAIGMTASNASDGNEVPEWAVQNQQPILPGPGTYTLTTPAFRCWHPAEGDDRSPVAADHDFRAALAAGGQRNNPGGAGPEGGYTSGETEDYYIQPLAERTPVQYDWGDAPDEAATAVYPDAGGTRWGPTRHCRPVARR